MSIGTALAEARRGAGLTVGQVSEKTRIRETIIKGIERDDYRACGGDFYARGHIRAIARVVGTDPAPLIQEYDETLRAPEDITAAEAFGPAMPLGKREPGSDPEPGGPEQQEPVRRGSAGDREAPPRRGTLWRRKADKEPGTHQDPEASATSTLVTGAVAGGGWPEPDSALSEPDTAPQPAVIAPIAESAPPLAEPPGEPVTPVDAQPVHAQPVDAQPAGEFRPAEKLDLFTASTAPRPAAGRLRLNRTYVLALALLAAIGVLGYLLIGGSGQPTKGSPAAASGSRHSASNARGRAQPSSRPAPARSTPAAAASPAQPLSPVSATALGPPGRQGDDPASARLAISGGTWHSDWYATANFGNLQAGTGLLLDMGRPVTVTGAQMTLSNSPGASLQLRAGNAPAMASLAPVAGASNAGGALQLSLSKPVTCRYVLIWFTKLPPDSSGTFQVSVSDVRLKVLA